MKKLLVILLLALMLVSCADKEIVGRWYQVGTESYVVFRDDGVVDFGTYSMDYEAEDGILTMIVGDSEQAMDYTISNDRLVITTDDFEMHYVRADE